MTTNNIILAIPRDSQATKQALKDIQKEIKRFYKDRRDITTQHVIIRPESFAKCLGINSN